METSKIQSHFASLGGVLDRLRFSLKRRDHKRPFHSNPKPKCADMEWLEGTG